MFTLGAVLVSGQLYMVIPLLHDMATGWGSTTGALAWLVTAFAIGYGVGFLLFGPLSDRFGRRRLLMVGMPLAALTTALVAVSPGAEMAIVLRGLQGWRWRPSHRPPWRTWPNGWSPGVAPSRSRR